MTGDVSLKRYLRRQRRRLLFSRFRNPLRKIVAPFFVTFSFIDYFYKPENTMSWLYLRVIFLFIIFGAFELLKIETIRKKYTDIIAIFSLCSACWIIDLMIAQSGGYTSLYMTGLILVSVTGVEMGRMNRQMSFTVYSLSYLPAIGIILYTSIDKNEIHIGVVQSFFMFGMIFLSVIYKGSEDSLQLVWNRAKLNRQEELERHRRIELLNRSFPPAIRKAIQNGDEPIPRKKVIERGVVGFADIIGSTSMANTLGLERDWDLKQEFFKIASRRALSADLIVLNPAGDGFLFLANYKDTTDWGLNVVSFFEGLLRDFEELKKTQLMNYSQIDTGVKIGVAKGRVILGLIGDENQMHLTAMGPEVNLASRMCDKATKSEMVITNEVWKSIKSSLVGWETRIIEYSDIKGFPTTIPTVHIKRRLDSNKTNVCPDCSASLTVYRNDQGFFDIRCPNEADGNHSHLNRDEAS